VIDDGAGKCVILVTRDHVSGAGHVDVVPVGKQREQLFDACLGDHVGLAAAHHQRGHTDACCGSEQPLGGDRARGFVHTVGDQRGIPVPVPATVRALSNVLLQALELRRPRAPGVVGVHGIGHLLQAREAIEVVGHEAHDALHTGKLDPRHHVHEHQRARERCALALGK
jgi:hypothetical protein